MPRFIQWIISACLTAGVGSALVSQTFEMAKAAVEAHQNHQMSYSKFTKAMVRTVPHQYDKKK
ncbi:MAG: hypothetical protein ACLGGX_03395 [Bdellovibrionia bacterium]|uniref:hypothetical protein n=1 Tax=Bdellovibrio sp. TaxID=28201 RepID=UPI001A3E8B56|nr:MAG: hypothetical protein BroJett040_08280 [Oligoflexia bacterium]